MAGRDADVRKTRQIIFPIRKRRVKGRPRLASRAPAAPESRGGGGRGNLTLRVCRWPGGEQESEEGEGAGEPGRVAREEQPEPAELRPAGIPEPVRSGVPRAGQIHSRYVASRNAVRAPD